MSESQNSHVHVRIGRGIALVIDSTAALLDERNGELADRLWAVVRGGGGVDLILEELSATGLRALGDFVMAEREPEGIRFVVRGNAVAIAHDDSESVTIDAANTRTWAEVIVNDATGFVLQLDGFEPASGSPFRLSSGIVPADALLWGSAVTSAKVDGTDLAWAADFVPPIVEREEADIPSVSVAEPSDVSVPAPVDDVEMIEVAEPRPAPEPEVSSPTDAWNGGNIAEAIVVAADSTNCETDGHESGDDETMVDELADVDSDENSIDTIFPGSIDDAASVADSDDDPDDDGLEYDALFGNTTFKPVQNAAVTFDDDGVPIASADVPPVPLRPSPPLVAPSGVPTVMLSDAQPPDSPAAVTGGIISAVPSGGPTSAAPGDATGAVPGDHDGFTMSIAQLRALRGERELPVATAMPPALGGAAVQALLCSSGHPSPSHAVVCRTCGLPISGTSVVIARPRLGRLVASSGMVIELDRPAILGRRPKAEGSLVGEIPQLIVLGELQGLSRSHAMVKLEQWQVLVEDLGSANGTVVTLPGRDPRRLHQSDPMLLEHGAVIDLGGEISLTVELGS